MLTIFAIDPGTDKSGWVVYEPGTNRVVECDVTDNYELREFLMAHAMTDSETHLAIEMIHSQGMAVGAETFETCVWIGRFMESWFDPNGVIRILRHEVKMHICGHPRAKDPNIRQAIIDMFPATGGGKVRQVGTSKQPGPLFGMNSHTWPALGVALATAARLKEQQTNKRRRFTA